MDANINNPSKEPTDKEKFLEEDFLTGIEVANKLRTTLSTLSYWRKHKVGPEYVKVGNHYKYPATKMAEFLKNKTNI